MKERVLVVGSNSFSGSDFIDLLFEEGCYEVMGVSRSPEKSALFLSYKRHANAPFIFHQIDLNHDIQRLEELIDQFRPDYIVNFAAQGEVVQSWDNPHHWFQTNAVGTTMLAHMLKDKKWIKRYIHISSPEVYGTCLGLITEEAPLNPSTPYAASKAAGDLSLFTYYKNFDLPLVMIRATNVYGAHQQLYKIIPRTAIYVQIGKKVELHGGGVAIKSFIHIRDISRGELMAMKMGRLGEIYHFSPNEGIEVRNVVHKICDQLRMNFKDFVLEVGERLGQDKAYTISSAKARKEFGWEPKITFDQGIEQVIKWVRANLDEIKRQPLQYQHKI